MPSQPAARNAAAHDAAATKPAATKPTSKKSAASEAILARTDIVRNRGRLTMLNTAGLTPQEAMVLDLLAVRRALDEGGIEYLLVRGNDARPVLAIDTSLREKLRECLVAAFAREPFHARSVDTRKSTVLVADGLLAKGREAVAVALANDHGVTHHIAQAGEALADC